MAKGFFRLFGYSVKTEFEIFKLPQKVDVVILRSKRTTQPASNGFTVLDYFLEHNLISFKLFKDNFSTADVLELIIYFVGYINAEKSARIDNTTATLIVTKMPTKVNQMTGLHKLAEGKYILKMNLFSVYIVNVNEIEITGNDAYFLIGYGKSERLQSFIPKIKEKATTPRERKIVDKIN
ncbi:MAG TPA: hypothetical protein PLY93_03980 [Turneriella sp.]|nr:hypothetical protein [Turneriella sp.]